MHAVVITGPRQSDTTALPRSHHDRQAFPGVKLGGGAATSLTELNRRSTYGMPIGQLDFVTHSTSAIVHDAGDVPIMQTLEALPYVTHTAREIIARGAPIRLSMLAYSLSLRP